jgi:hypothetical protein
MQRERMRHKIVHHDSKRNYPQMLLPHYNPKQHSLTIENICHE